jgi:hypothetical protein
MMLFSFYAISNSGVAYRQSFLLRVTLQAFMQSSEIGVLHNDNF